MSGTGAIRWGDISFSQNETTGRRRCGGRRRARSLHRWTVAGPGRATHRHKPRPIGGRREACGAWPRCRWAAAGPAGQRGDASSHTQQPGATGVKGAGGTGGPGCGARGRWRGLAGLRDDAPSRRLAARTARGRAAAHRHTQRPGPSRQASGARNTRGSTSNAGDQAGPQAAPPQRAEGNPYSPRNALIAGISRTACTRPAR